MLCSLFALILSFEQMVVILLSLEGHGSPSSTYLHYYGDQLQIEASQSQTSTVILCFLVVMFPEDPRDPRDSSRGYESCYFVEYHLDA